MRLHSFKPALLLAGTLICSSSVFAANMAFSGELIEPACSLDKGTIPVNMGMTYTQYLYKYQRTVGTPFELLLKSCDLTHTNKVKITFDGVRNANLPTFLIVNGSTVRGVAIGLETPSGQALTLGSSENYALLAGNNVLKLNAYLQGEPNALLNQTIRPGSFTSTATFTLEYF